MNTPEFLRMMYPKSLQWRISRLQETLIDVIFWWKK